MSEERSHKAHHPSQSGKKREKKAKGKERQNVSNDKVSTCSSFLMCQGLMHIFLRHSHPDQVEKQKDRVVAQQRKIRLVFTFPSSIVPLMTPLHR
jgi:hypothetical protein